MGSGSSISELTPEHQVVLAQHLHEEYLRHASPQKKGGGRLVSLEDDRLRGPLLDRVGDEIGELLRLSLAKRSESGADNTALLTEEVLDACREGDRERLIALLSDQGSADSINGYTGSALMEAAGRGHEDCVRTLIGRSADLDLEDVAGKTALDYAIEREQPEVVRLLLGAGASGVAAVHRACWAGDLATVRLLLGIDGSLACCENKYGRTALAAACLAESLRIGEVLLDGGARVDRKAMRLRTALMDCCVEGKPLAVDLLLRHGAKVSFQDMDGLDARALAVRTGGRG